MFPLTLDGDSPIMLSVQDAQRSQQRAMCGIEKAVNASPVLEFGMMVGPAANRVGTKVRVTAEWAGINPMHPPVSAWRATKTSDTVMHRGMVLLKATATVAGAETTVSQTADLEIPCIVGADMAGTPPDAGYFVVLGDEFVMRYQERVAFGWWIVTTNEKAGPTAKMRCVPRFPGDALFTCSLKKRAAAPSVQCSKTFRHSGGGTKREARTLPLAAVLVLLGERSVDSFRQRVGCSFDSASLSATWPASIADADQAVAAAARRGYGAEHAAHTHVVVNTWVLPHISSPTLKLNTLAAGIAAVSRAGTPGWAESDDLDHQVLHRVDAPGDLLASCVGANWHRHWSSGRKGARQELPTAGAARPTAQEASDFAAASALATAVATVDAASKALKKAFSVQGWVGPAGEPLDGVCERPEHYSAASMISTHRRTSSNMGESARRKREPRLPHGSTYGLLCPSETPDDENIGISLALASSACTSSSCWDVRWIPRNDRHCMEPGLWHLVVDGVCLGRVSDPHAYKAAFFEARRAEMLRRGGTLRDEDCFAVACVTCSLRRGECTGDGDGCGVGVCGGACTGARSGCEVRVRSDAGRLVRPLLVAHKVTGERLCFGTPEMPASVFALLALGAAEFVDAGHVDDHTFCIASKPPVAPHHSHVEFHPGMYLGVFAFSVPFAECDQGTRITFFSSSQGKQGVGVPSTRVLASPEVHGSLLVYPQKPLVYSKGGCALRQDDLPGCMSTMQQIGFFHGYNVEDALIVNKAAIQRGMGTSFLFETCHTETRAQKPEEKEEGTRFEADGTLPVGTEVPSDVRLAHCFKGAPAKNTQRTSVVVDSVMMEGGPFDPHACRIRTRQWRQPEKGDKMCSCHGQKGVVGFLIAQDRMPFTAGGEIADTIMNMHAFPSRMSVGHMLEYQAGTLALRQGSRVAVTPMENIGGPSMAALMAERLRSAGADASCGHVTYDGQTCDRLPEKHLLAPVTYLRLKHHVRDKFIVQNTASGGVDPRTFQPTRGHRKHGSLRLGEMEQDAMEAWGCLLGLRTRFLGESDGCVVPFCRVCGLTSTEQPKLPSENVARVRCDLCADKAKKLGVPYAPSIAHAYMGRCSLLAMATMRSMGIVPRVKFGDEDEGTK